MTGFEKSQLPCTITTYQQLLILVILIIVSWKENRCLHAILHNSVVIQSLSVDQLLNGQLYVAELPTNLNICSFITGIIVANTTSHKVANKNSVKTENSQMASISAIFSSTYHIKQLHPEPFSRAVMWWFIAGSLLVQGDGAILRSLMHWWKIDNLGLRNKPQQKTSLSKFQGQYLPELLVHYKMYSCRMLMKSVTCCCV